MVACFVGSPLIVCLRFFTLSLYISLSLSLSLSLVFFCTLAALLPFASLSPFSRACARRRAQRPRRRRPARRPSSFRSPLSRACVRRPPSSAKSALPPARSPPFLLLPSPFFRPHGMAHCGSCRLRAKCRTLAVDRIGGRRRGLQGGCKRTPLGETFIPVATAPRGAAWTRPVKRKQYKKKGHRSREAARPHNKTKGRRSKEKRSPALKHRVVAADGAQ